MALGALNPALGYGLGLLGLTTVSASLAVLVWAAATLLMGFAGGFLSLLVVDFTGVFAAIFTAL